MPTRTILLSNGLVSSRSPCMLGDGDLSEAVNVEYRQNDPAVHKVNGHELFSSFPSAGGCYGMFHLKFDNADSVLLVATAFSLWGGPPRTVWSGFSDTNNSNEYGYVALSDENNLTGQFDCVNYLDNYYILLGGDFFPSLGERRNFYVGPDFAWGANGYPKFHGMAQNVSQPTISPTGGSGAGFTLTAGTKIIYWVEERVKDSLGNIIKRNSGSSATTTGVTSGGTLKPVITCPTIVNSDTTHWALYSTSNSAVYPIGSEIGENPIADLTLEDTRTGTLTVAAPVGGAYKTVTAVVGGVSLTVPRYGAMPRSSFGDIFEDSLVTNDLDAPKYIAWSYTGDPQAFPALYRLPLNSKEGDTITMIRRVGGSLIVGMTDSVWRLSTLPKFSDSSFDAERVKGQIEGAHGAVSQKSSTLYSSMEGIRLAYTSSYGIRTTDGASWYDATADIDWAGTVGVDKLSSCFMVNNPSKYRLEFYYADNDVQKLTYTLGGVKVTFDYIPNKCLYLHYHPSHAKQSGAMKITGPHPIGATAGCVVYNGTEREVWLMSTRSTVLDANIIKTDVASSGVFVDGAGSRAIDMSVTSGEYYLAGPLGEATVNDVVVNHTAGANQQDAQVGMTTRSEDRADLTDYAQIPVEREGQSTANITNYGLGASHKFSIKNSDALGSFGVNYIALDHSPTQALGGFAKTDGT